MFKRNFITLSFILISFNIYGQHYWPVEGEQSAHRITDTFGHRLKGDFPYDFDWHAGVDISVSNESTSNILAVIDGHVKYALDWQFSGYDDTIFILHGDTVATQYSHLEDFDVTVGEDVTGGQDIADGETGLNSHLHFNLLSAHRDDLARYPVSDDSTMHPMQILPYTNEGKPTIFTSFIAGYIKTRKAFTLWKKC